MQQEVFRFSTSIFCSSYYVQLIQNIAINLIIFLKAVCGDLRGISQPSISRIVSEVSESLCRKMKDFIKFPSSHEEIKEVQSKFFKIGHFPLVIGCIDGTHIPIKSPGGNNAEIFRNRKGIISLNIQVVTGPELEILDIVIRWPGSAHDSRIYNNSTIKIKMESVRLKGRYNFFTCSQY